ncbi:magnesium/cobalt transporter CorA [Rufibacter glacialis]|uniref:Magnesium transport protein CorA n=1 Tax=Rufibacter glacialis TaxID=1259555 RepID=A0A5M8QBG0_9BACT|nr:magnesium/cobalt transporter CorA [Rufibacter glacialis]KAA6431842.1 magnesium/cobalt transporter CorA [Rufibacter glacialis]GGK81103.1 magnesium transport protein CorA [Rufibacter glacialis]
MIRGFYIREGEIHWEKNPENLVAPGKGRTIWVDLQAPTDHEQRVVEEEFGIEFFTQQEAAEIESSSRYFEDDDIFEANSAFVMHHDGSYSTRQVSFILKNDILFTLRRTEMKSFAEAVRKLKTIRSATTKAFQIWLLLLETQIDYDADFIELLTRTTNVVSKRLVKEQSIEEEVLLRITELQENTILIRESIVDKQRLVSSLLRSYAVDEPEKERLRTIIKDINSLLQHTQFSFERLEYLQNTFLGLVNIEQNQVIKIFTVMTVVFMPPTLIASIYGMNFEVMPELKWVAGYPFALGMMVLSSLCFLWYFKRKKWL